MDKPRVRLCICAVALLAFAAAAGADDLAQQGRAILDVHKDHVVTVKMVVKISGMGSAREMPQEVTGTVIDPTGMVVVALSASDPTSILRGMMGSFGDGVDMASEVSQVKILLEDDTEVPAEIVLRDKDLDLAFVRPEQKPEEPVSSVDLADPGQPEIMDQLITLNRLGKVALRTHSVSVERVEAVVEKPRTFYIPGKDPTQTALGSPAFTPDGKFVGIVVMRTIKGEGMGGLFGGMGQNVMQIIVPAADIQEAAEQAPPFAEKTDEEVGEADSSEAQEQSPEG